MLPTYRTIVYATVASCWCTSAVALAVRAQPAATSQPGTGASVQPAAHVWKNPDPIGTDEAAQENDHVDGRRQLEVYLLRHGETTVNAKPWLHHLVLDGLLDSKGLDQAVAARETLDTLGIARLTPDSLQLAASTLSRAFDTTVLATASLVSEWDAQGFDFRIHEVPAAMEFDPTGYSTRKKGVRNDDPVRFEDSALSHPAAVAHLKLEDGANPYTRFYHLPEDTSHTLANVTTKPVEVCANYSRFPIGRGVSLLELASCDLGHGLQQLETLKRYFVDNAMAGKTHVLLGTSGVLVQFLMKKFSSNNLVATSSGKTMDVSAHQLPNGAILHVRMLVPQTGTLDAVSMEPVYVHLNKVR